MKKNLFSMLVISVLALAFVGCTNPAGGSSYSAKYAVGDIILNDGSKVNYETAKNYTGSDLDGLKSKAIAVIFRADTASKKALGVGLKHNGSGLAWCTSDAKAYNTNIKTIQCPASVAAGNFTFTGDTDGSDNLEQIASFLTTADLADDTTGTDADKRYPAFYFAKNYKNTATNLGAVYGNGWYLPTVAELFDIWKVKATVDAASSLCGGSQFGDSCYWSSSQYASYDISAYGLYFDGGDWSHFYKDNITLYVCAVRAFN
ncbi:MAG: hypothetical protein PUJ61_02755 [Spirochaetia bacterium]|nr:hypothetical protein [Spirochaetia bacterium]